MTAAAWLPQQTAVHRGKQAFELGSLATCNAVHARVLFYTEGSMERTRNNAS